MKPLVLPGPEGSITVSAGALTQLVVTAAESVEGARVRRPRRAIELERQGGSARVALGVAAPYDRSLPDLARDVQERVAAAVAASCGLEVATVDVAIEAVV
jgi:uncharacterized alkaline shock family protein YloU